MLYKGYREILFQRVALGLKYTLYRTDPQNNILKHVFLHTKNNLKHVFVHTQIRKSNNPDLFVKNGGSAAWAEPLLYGVLYNHAASFLLFSSPIFPLGL